MRLTLVAALVAVGCAQPVVVRVVDGREVPGRFIGDRAYALYGRGADAEARGDAHRALDAYAAAADDDPDSPEIWTRIGALRCRLGARRGDPDEAFERAAHGGADYAELWLERARCDVARGRLGPAEADAARALELDPDDEDAAVLHAQVLDRLGRRADATRELVAVVTARPASRPAWRAMLAHAELASDTAWRARATRELAAIDPEGAPAAPRLARVDEALAAGDLRAARRAALAAHLLSSELAARAAALGRGADAVSIATLVLDADPSDATARIALAAGADLVRDDAALTRALVDLGHTLAPPSPLARLLYAELLARRIGKDVARAWLGPEPRPAVAVDDPLLARVTERAAAAAR